MELIGKINAANLSASVNSDTVFGIIGMYHDSNVCNLKDIGIVRTNGIHNGKVVSGYSGTVAELEEE